MIAYMIQCHTDFTQVGRLLEWLYHEDDVFILSIDANAQDDDHEIDRFLERGNVLLAPRHRITWGGVSIVQATLTSIRQILNSAGWEYFINLSAVDIPLITRTALIEALAHHARHDVFNFVSDFGPLALMPLVWQGEFNRRVAITAPGPARIELHDAVINFMTSDTLDYSYFKPVLDANARIAFHVDEGSDGRFLSCRPLYPFEAEERRNFARAIPYKYGRQWVILHRAICEILFVNDIATTVYQNIRNTFISDELFFQTLFGTLPEAIPRSGLLRHNQRYYYGAPERITDQNYAAVRASGAWFARKLVVSEGAEIIAFTNALTAR